MSLHRMRYVSFVALLILLRIFRSLTQNIIEIPDGKIVGVTDQWVTSYLGVRYAQRPVRARRMAPPVPVPSWKGTLRADNYGPVCLQVPYNVRSKYFNDVQQSEDCLTLNIYISRDANPVNLPVLVFIHPGQFQSGAGVMVNGSLLAMETGSVVVTFNYRLGVLGFASYRSILSGNYGILDQILAIKWVRRNIAAFGGDQNNIAILADTVNARILRHSSRLNGTFAKIVSLPLDFPYTLLSKSDVTPTETILETACNGTLSLECIQGLNPGNLLNLSTEQSPWDLPLFRPQQDDDVINSENPRSDTPINMHIEQLHLNVVAPSYIFRKTSVVIRHQQYQCTPKILKNVIQLISTMTSSNVKTLLETFYYPDDVTASSICTEILRLVYDYASVYSMNEVNRASRSALVFLALLERYFVVQGGTSDPLCIFRGGGEGCDSDATAALVLTTIKNFLKHRLELISWILIRSHLSTIHFLFTSCLTDLQVF